MRAAETVGTGLAAYPGLAMDGLLGALVAERPARLQRVAAEAMAIHETSFFRDAAVFGVLREVVLPRLIEAGRSTRRLRIWSAGCSTGQEAYSLAMLLCEDFPEVLDWDVKIVGTDVSCEVVEYARRGRYRRTEASRGLPVGLRAKYMARAGDEWEISPQVRGLCEFRRADLCEPMAGNAEFELVLLRNVLLYLSPEDQVAGFAAVRRQVTRGGCLVLGRAEQAEDWTRLFEAEVTKGCYFYRPAG